MAAYDATVLEESINIVDAFRQLSVDRGLREAERVPVISRHDPSIRFTNSTISVLKPLMVDEVTTRSFLVQPAVRLRNLTTYQKTKTMTPFGCSFMALGLLLPTPAVHDAASIARDMLLRGLGAIPDRCSWRVFAEDTDLHRIAKDSGLRAVSDSNPGPYRHSFGVVNRTGRNINLHINSEIADRAVANLILIEDDLGRSIGVELAAGVSMLVAQGHNIPHPVLASPASGAIGTIDDLMILDALLTSLNFAFEGLQPVARGRGGNYRSLLKIAIDRGLAPKDEATRDAICRIANLEFELRNVASPLCGNAELDPEEAARQVCLHLEMFQSLERQAH